MTHRKLVVIDARCCLPVLLGQIKFADIPEDSTLVAIGCDIARNAWTLLIEHDSFPVVDAGMVAPVLIPRITPVDLITTLE